ncbi:hypothetical protein [Pseudonocardia hydrocarbonoxydans]|uniref:Dihydrodiol dehydrogenase n=1 Tax=Pseudonocardia hydrocarbonoxydans TaxID=76726 RepID=A0A4Y3WGB1_9PSEU|nr:hypothetical protein [Pseudonocardia hydrocarbonoxydans]GEC18032.1 hypothetical protein PHY01_03150 [Pseudonocardia hydrocarbonoxydans]
MNADQTDTWVVRNEFAMVEVALDRQAHDARLRITDRQTGRTVHLDALELEALTRIGHGDLRSLLDPSGPTAVLHED